MNHMNSVHVDRRRVLQLTNEELSKCRRRIADLEAERDATFTNIEAAEGGGGGGGGENRALADRLHRKHAKICREIEAELTLEEKVIFFHVLQTMQRSIPGYASASAKTVILRVTIPTADFEVADTVTHPPASASACKPLVKSTETVP